MKCRQGLGPATEGDCEPGDLSSHTSRPDEGVRRMKHPGGAGACPAARDPRAAQLSRDEAGEVEFPVRATTPTKSAPTRWKCPRDAEFCGGAGDGEHKQRDLRAEPSSRHF